ncbi:MAG TPA: hypothetical protein VEC01_08400 [Noviherbaspirillum sp.]|uniref:hypothetical protein n=1 Tax=Noviherbaspirillum sp. TaxID=1926288 RepID=UPI002D2F5D9D|nr:hypothetical protein [Noviherbaspirillum sp.]HYD95332.1 hypothetical protein [Noviherbaspirillum sp.]
MKMIGMAPASDEGSIAARCGRRTRQVGEVDGFLLAQEAEKNSACCWRACSFHRGVQALLPAVSGVRHDCRRRSVPESAAPGVRSRPVFAGGKKIFERDRLLALLDAELVEPAADLEQFGYFFVLQAVQQGLKAGGQFRGKRESIPFELIFLAHDQRHDFKLGHDGTPKRESKA